MINMGKVMLITTGGLGIFLIGMIIMTSGLKSFAGDNLKTTMLSLTKSPYSGALSGATMTAILQSSSATTVAAVGFVGAGIIGFSEALGIIFGANLGTTITGWIVALFGFKFKLGTLAYPIVFIGAILKLFAKNYWSDVGFALAGFGLIFVGISTMQTGMIDLQSIINPSSLPDNSILGLLQLLLLGIVFTIITQSSSAGVATTLTILYTGLINFEQAAALVIGMDVGTTLTAALATLGGDVNVKRTGFSHVIFNIFTAIGAFLFIPFFIDLWNYFQFGSIVENGEIALVVFHTTFNLVGVLLILPFANIFGKMIKNIFKEDKLDFIHKLDSISSKKTYSALDTSLFNIRQEFILLLKYINTLLDNSQKSDIDIVELKTAIVHTQNYIDKIVKNSQDDKENNYLIAIVHSLDHINRLHERCYEDRSRALKAIHTKELKTTVSLLQDSIQTILDALETNDYNKARDISKTVAYNIKENIQPFRESITKKVANKQINIKQTREELEALRWLYRVSSHIFRINVNLRKAILESGEKK